MPEDKMQCKDEIKVEMKPATPLCPICEYCGLTHHSIVGEKGLYKCTACNEEFEKAHWEDKRDDLSDL